MDGIASDSNAAKSAVDLQSKEEVAELGCTVGQNWAVSAARWVGDG